MQDPAFIPITLMFLALVALAFFQKLYRVILLLGMAYVAFIIYAAVTEPEKPTPVAERYTQFSAKDTLMDVPITKETRSHPVSLPDSTTITPVQESPPESPPVKKPKHVKLILNNITVCEDISNRRPVKTSESFDDTVGYVYCYTGIQNFGETHRIGHQWSFEGRSMGTIYYDIQRSVNWRSWSRFTIAPENTGSWEVTILDSSGSQLGSTTFHIRVSDKDAL